MARKDTWIEGTAKRSKHTLGKPTKKYRQVTFPGGARKGREIQLFALGAVELATLAFSCLFQPAEKK